MRSLCVTVKMFSTLLNKGLRAFFRGIYVRVTSHFRSFYNQYRFQHSFAKFRNVFSPFGFSLVFLVWFLVRPVVLNGELSQSDRNFLGAELVNIQQELSSIDHGTDVIFDRLHLTNDRIYNFHTDNNSHLGQLIRLGISEGTILTNIVSRLDTIITALEKLDSDDISGGESSSSDLLTESTFVTKYDDFSNAFGFGGSAGSLYTLLNTQAQFIEKIHQGLGYSFYGNGDLKYDVGQVITALNTANTSLNTIISELESLNSKDFGGSGSSSTTINQDWLKEATFTQKYDLLLNALGFGSGSNLSGSLNDILTVLNDIKNKDFSGGGTDVSSITQDWLKEATFTEKWQTFSNGFGYSGGSSGGSLVEDIKAIITALETIDTTLKTNTGGSIVTEDLLQETTFIEKFDNFQSSFGFSGGSSGSLKDYLYSFYTPASSKSIILPSWVSWYGVDSPFPGNIDSKWPEISENSQSMKTVNISDGFEYLSKMFYYHSLDSKKWDLALSKKESWNDWQAHTNMVDTIYNVFKLKSDSDITFDEKTGMVTLERQTEGSSPQEDEYSIIPVSTNTVETGIIAVTNSTEKIATVYEKEMIKKRYLNDMLIEVGKNYGIGDEGGSDSSLVWETSWFVIDFKTWSASYRSFMTVETLKKGRNIMSKFWTLVSTIVCILIVRQWGNM